MLTLQDCIGLSGLTSEQVEAIADHEHLDMILAAEWAETVLDRPNGQTIVEHILIEEISFCRDHGCIDRLRRFQHGLEELRGR